MTSGSRGNNNSQSSSWRICERGGKERWKEAVIYSLNLKYWDVIFFQKLGFRDFKSNFGVKK